MKRNRKRLTISRIKELVDTKSKITEMMELDKNVWKVKNILHMLHKCREKHEQDEEGNRIYKN